MPRFYIRHGFREVASQQMPLVLVFACWLKFQFCKVTLLPFSFTDHWCGRFTVYAEKLVDAEFIADC
jgi:hypothetical protein